MSDGVVAADVANWRRLLAEALLGGPLALVVPLAGAGALIAFPFVSGDLYWIREISLIAIFALVVSGLNLSFGFAGEFQLGQVFAFGLGCYLTMILAVRAWDEVIALVIIGGLAAAFVGGVIALPALRVGGWPLAIVSLFLVITIPDLVAIFPALTGGLSGLIDIPYPHLFGRAQGTDGLYEITVIVAIVWFAVYRNLVTSRYGVALRILRQSPVLAGSLGLSPMRLKVTAYALGAFPAGMAGCLFGFISLVIAPSVFDLTLATGIVAASILGGSESVYGAIVGAAILQLGPQSSLSFDQYAPIAYGGFLIVAAITFRAGLSGVGKLVALRLSNALAGPRADAGTATKTSPLRPLPGSLRGAVLTVSSLSKAFGGVHALNDVSLTARPGEVTALIGSNGSGKTTLLNVISGFGRANGAGVVALGDTDIHGLAPHVIARAGVARTFQTPSIPRGVSAVDVVASGRFTRDRRGVASCVLRLPGYRRSRRADRLEALALLDLLGIREIARQQAASLSLGTRRLVEVARALNAKPRLLLLDEPAAGLNAREMKQLGEVVKDVARAGAAVVLVEHNFAFVSDVADVTHVLDHGALIASGPASTVAEAPAVVETFLGRSAGPATVPERRRPARSELALEIRGLESGYGDLRVLRDVSLRLRRGTLETVLGRNGVGKTTLLGTIAGQIKLRAGSITLDGREVSRLPAYRRAAAGIAFVPEGKRIFRERTIEQNIALGTASLSLSRREQARLCSEVLEQFPALQARSGERAGNLSGGQQQMLAIGQALAARPKVLLLDEPSSGLAPSVVADVFQSLRRLGDDGVTVLLVEQLAERALEIADHVTVLDNGRIVSSGEPADYHDMRGLRETYLGGLASAGGA